MFETLSIKRCYRSKKDNLDKDFIIPLLKDSVCYDRGTGYFSLSVLSELSDGLIPYVRHNGKIRIISSVELDLEDLKVVNKGLEIAKSLVSEELVKEIDKELNTEKILSMDLITNLIAANILQIKIAFLPQGGLYHEKVGYLEDSDGKSVWFAGSTNETHNGYKKNVESFIVLKSWEGDKQDIDEQKEYFESLWNNEDEDVRVFDFPEAAKNHLFSKYKRSNTVQEAIEQIENRLSNHEKKGKQLYPYQELAIKQFLENDCNHFYEMATGTGKTFTATKTIQKMIENGICNPLYVVIIVPQIDLQIQWQRELQENEIEPFLFGGNSSYKDWKSEFERSIIYYFNGDKKLIVSICVFDTYFAKIAKELETKKINKMIIVDEAHELSSNQMKALSSGYIYRLGLSATPERHDIRETEEIINYFTRGRIEPFKYMIDEAIPRFLSPYEYHPIKVHLDDEEFLKYKALTKQLAVLLNQNPIDHEKVQEVCNNRSVIVKKAKSKPETLRKMIISKDYDFINAVIYCGQGKDPINDEKIIDTVTKYLYQYGNLKVSQFTSETERRTDVLQEFENGYYDTLVAIKCFDQGVDVPKLDKIYIMASDSLNRQTIQRRGRVLRKCKETGKERAFIYDMVTLPPEGEEDSLGAKALVSKEIKRAREYERLALNKDQVSSFIDYLVEEYDITEDSDDENGEYD